MIYDANNYSSLQFSIQEPTTSSKPPCNKKLISSRSLAELSLFPTFLGFLFHIFVFFPLKFLFCFLHFLWFPSLFRKKTKPKLLDIGSTIRQSRQGVVTVRYQQEGGSQELVSQLTRARTGRRQKSALSHMTHKTHLTL